MYLTFWLLSSNLSQKSSFLIKMPIGARAGLPFYKMGDIFPNPLGSSHANLQQFPIEWSFERNYQNLGTSLKMTFIVIIKIHLEIVANQQNLARESEKGPHLASRWACPCPSHTTSNQGSFASYRVSGLRLMSRYCIWPWSIIRNDYL